MASSWMLLGEYLGILMDLQSVLAKYGRNRAGVDALALDPQDDTKVYIALGEYTNR